MTATASLLAQTGGESRAEAGLRRELRAAGAAGYRAQWPLGAAGLPRRTADVAWPGRRVAVFLDGCFWHGCPRHGASPPPGYWADKVARNRARDRATTRALRAAGWRVIRVWEHQDRRLAARRITGSLVHLPRGAPRRGV